MTTVTVKASRTYEVRIGKGLLEKAGASLASLLPPPRTLMVVSDDAVAALWGDKLTASLTAAGYTVQTFVFPHGEASKTTDTVTALWNALAKAELTRTDWLRYLDFADKHLKN